MELMFYVVETENNIKKKKYSTVLLKAIKNTNK